MRLLITGANGFVGTHLRLALRDQEVELHCLSRSFRASTGREIWHKLDYSPSSLADLMQRVAPTDCIHLAWTSKPPHFWNDPDNLICLAASLSLLRQFQKFGGRRFVAIGTCAEYRGGLEPSGEEDAVEPSTLYGVSKDAFRRVLQSFAAESGLSWAWARLFYLYGPGEPQGKLVTSISQALLRGLVPSCSGDEQLLDYLHVEDVAGYLSELTFSDFSGILNIGSGHGTTVRQVVGELLARVPGRVDFREPTGPPMFNRVANTLRLHSVLKRRPRWSLARGLAHTVESLINLGVAGDSLT